MSAFTDDDAVAAEYVIGTLPPDERANAEARRRQESAFDDLVYAWAERLSPLVETIPTVEPDPALRDAVLADIDRMRARRAEPPLSEMPGHVVALRRQVARWRFATVMCGSLAALLAIWLATSRFLLATAPDSYMAVLQQGAGAPAFLVSLNLADRRMVVIPADAPVAPDKSFELWMIGSDATAPRSLGVVDTPTRVRASLPDVSADQISRATYAVTVEPKGGSPSGKPTSAPVYVGHLVPMSPTSGR